MNSSVRGPFRGAWAGVFAVMAVSALAGDWPAFRGPNGDGIAEADKAPIRWGPGWNVRWRESLPGPGNSSPIVSHGRVFVTCADDEGRKRHLFCFDRINGARLWVQTAAYLHAEPTHRSNPYCASTPVADSSRVIVWHGSAGVFCYNFGGAELWRKDLGPVRHDWGYASSPIIHRGKVLLNFGPGSRTFLAALDLRSGEVVWKHEEVGGMDTTNERMVGSWSTPTVIQVDGTDQVLCTMPTRAIACDAESGALLWFCEGLADPRAELVYASPVVWNGVGVAFTGWVNGPTIGFRLGGSGDVTATHRLWLENQPSRIGSGIVVEGNLYVVNAGPGTAQCIDVLTGKVQWTERLEGGESWGSLVMAEGRFYVTSRRGVTTVFRAGPEKLDVLALNDLGEPSNATPAISEGQIFLRTDGSIYCIADD